ncbi:MAG: VWA domain-containing protein [Candidatus Nitronauta litoralis]|uniref:VWA domain-containing protein n=1 Tax=Candidatus Nitronauta litoralis TaxID=2705533 RepID=A0A7T0G0B3_9BACT|nr:MAG: VWA domain-containing protein [Candidatus Nitronauta litoralis]
MKKIKHILRTAGLVALIGLIAVPAPARQVNLDVALGTPVITAGKKQTAFLKVSLIGQEHHSDRAPVNVSIVLDKSGSMAGDKIEYAKEAAIMAVNRLEAQDTLSLVTYDNVVRVILPAQNVVNKANLQNRIRNISSGGNTALFAGVSKGAHELRRYLESTRVNRVILLSDGLANVGPSTPSELGNLGSSLSREGISVTTIGLGHGYNEDLMTRLAGYSDGNHYFARSASDLVTVFNNEFSNVLAVVAKDVNVIIHCRHGIRPIRVLGRNYEIMGQRVSVDLNQLSSRQEKFVMLEVELPEGSAGQSREVASVDVNYLDLKSKRSDALQGLAAVRYSAAPEEVKRATNRKVMEKAVEQVSNEMSKDVLKSLDEGRVEEAQRLQEKNVSLLKESAKKYDSPALQSLMSEAEEDAEVFRDEAPAAKMPGRSGAFSQSPPASMEWNKKRKELKERQYKRETQQQY